MSENLNSLTYKLPENLQTEVGTALREWQNADNTRKLWAKDASVWTNDAQDNESKWLGWLDIVQRQLVDGQKFLDFAKEVEQEGFTHCVLLGMGGSSLCVDVLSLTYGKQNGYPEFHILDSTSPAQVKTIESKIDLAKTLFFVSSKSGSTLEPNIFKQYFFGRVAETVGRENAGKHFIAITDPNSKMQAVAEKDDFRRIYFGDATIGGRFSALSDFGMIPLAAMGVDVADFLQRTMQMVEACGADVPANENAGVILGVILGVANKHDIDKLTILAAPEISSVGAWMEQLIAESTGKIGKAIIPIDRETFAEIENYGDDRLFVYLQNDENVDSTQDDFVAKLEKAGKPVVRLNVLDKLNLGQEFFRWEIATAVAGSLLNINPFNQPDVEASKIETRKITDAYEQTGSLPPETPFHEENNIKLFTDDENLAALNEIVGDEKTTASYLKAHLSRIVPHDYFAILAYIEMTADHFAQLEQLRRQVLEEKHVATCLQFGPRFLHSTGQAYKGGTNSGVFLQITSEDAIDLEVPDQKYTFSVVKSAQARGDFQVLVDRERRALRVHLGKDLKTALSELQNAFGKV